MCPGDHINLSGQSYGLRDISNLLMIHPYRAGLSPRPRSCYMDILRNQSQVKSEFLTLTSMEIEKRLEFLLKYIKKNQSYFH